MSKKPDLATLFGASKVDTFLGVPACKDLADLNASSVFIGVPGATPYSSVGSYCHRAPEALRNAIASLSENINRYNFDLGGQTFPEGAITAVDYGDLNLDEEDSASNRKGIYDVVTQVVSKGSVPIIVGGDDSVPVPMLQAMENTKKKYTILQIDAHIDWRDSHMGESLGLSSTMRRASEMNHIEKIIQVGARSIGSGHPQDFQDAVQWGVKFITAYELHRNGVRTVLDLIEPDANVIVCLDVDALDPSIVPGVIGRAPGGLNYYQVLDLINGASTNGTISAINFVEYMPDVDVDGLGALVVSRLIANTMGILARQAVR